jgi:hypothetical protein
VVGEDLIRPWGGFLLISQASVRELIHVYFRDTDLQDAPEQLALSPKLLLVAPGRRLSWQYRPRRIQVLPHAHSRIRAYGAPLIDQAESSSMRLPHGSCE